MPMRAWKRQPRTAGLIYRACVAPSHIFHVCAITEAQEGLAVVRTKDEKLGIIEFWVSPDLRATFEEFLDALRGEIRINVAEPYEPDPDTLDGHWMSIGGD
jgi:hypothetical protein